MPLPPHRVRASLSGFFHAVAWRARRRHRRITRALAITKAVEALRATASFPTLSWRKFGTPSTTAPIGAIVQLLMLTGFPARRDRRLKWSEIDFDRALIVLPGARTKTGRGLESR